MRPLRLWEFDGRKKLGFYSAAEWSPPRVLLKPGASPTLQGPRDCPSAPCSLQSLNRLGTSSAVDSNLPLALQVKDDLALTFETVHVACEPTFIIPVMGPLQEVVCSKAKQRYLGDRTRQERAMGWQARSTPTYLAFSKRSLNSECDRRHLGA